MSRNSTDPDDRTATETLFYADGVQIPANFPGAIVSQRWVKDLINLFLPVGSIIIWAGTLANIPAGWALCNGQVVGAVGTPNLTGRFVIQADPTQFPPGAAAGDYTHYHNLTVNNTVLTWGQMPYHGHALSDPGHTHGSRLSPNLSTGGHAAQEAGSGGAIDTQAPVQSVTTGITIGTAGNNEGHNHTGTAVSASSMPPYYALAYIMKVAAL